MNLSSRLSRAKRAAPRIISRSYDKLRRVDDDQEMSPYYVPTDVEQELQSEIYMKGGVAVSVSGAAAKIASAAGEAAATHGYGPGAVSAAVGSTGATIAARGARSYAGAGESDGASPHSDGELFVELPGVANEVESYPCLFCGPDKVFLTVNGLERHAQDEHPGGIAEIEAHIVRIQNEWKRRRILGVRCPDSGDPVAGPGTAANVGRSPVILMPISQNKMNEICRRCGYAVDAGTPGAMDYHIEAHAKNDELRQHLIDEYGERFVEFVTCKQCTMVFADGRALFEHVQSNHKRKKFTGYICRWCGQICAGMSQLNAHKLQVHNISAHHAAQPQVGQLRPSINGSVGSTSYAPNSAVAGTAEPPDVPADDSPINVDAFDDEVAGAQEAPQPQPHVLDHIHSANARIVESLTNNAKVDEMAPCKTKCEICGLVMVKPSLLVRHMLRVHNKFEFVADVTSRHSAPLKFSIFAGGRVVWRCCDVDFADREEILMHRRLMHGRGASATAPVAADGLISAHAVDNSDTLPYENDAKAGPSEDHSDRTNLQHDGVPITCEEIFLESENSIGTEEHDENPRRFYFLGAEDHHGVASDRVFEEVLETEEDDGMIPGVMAPD